MAAVLLYGLNFGHEDKGDDEAPLAEAARTYG